jgi:hypothetical protein
MLVIRKRLDMVTDCAEDVNFVEWKSACHGKPEVLVHLDAQLS